MGLLRFSRSFACAQELSEDAFTEVTGTEVIRLPGDFSLWAGYIAAKK